MSIPTVNYDTMPLEELRALTIEFENQPVVPVTPSVAVVPAVEAAPVVDPAAPVVPEEKKRFRRVIDIGDGAGKQEFSGATLDELVENLAKAQENATRKIREQAAQLKANEKPAPAVKPPTAEERLAAIEARIAWSNTAAEFIAANPTYENTQPNAVKMERYMAANGIPKTLEGLTQAFNELSESGLLPATPAPKNDAAPVEGIPQPATSTVTPGQPVSSGLSARTGSLAQRAAKVELTEKDLQTMDINQLRQLTKQALEG
jgi:hypothetical protein